jgi:hypothetical protein
MSFTTQCAAVRTQVGAMSDPVHAPALVSRYTTLYRDVVSGLPPMIALTLRTMVALPDTAKIDTTKTLSQI